MKRLWSMRISMASGFFTSTMMFKFSSVTEPFTSAVANESYSGAEDFSSDFVRSVFQTVHKVLTLKIPFESASFAARRITLRVSIFHVAFPDIRIITDHVPRIYPLADPQFSPLHANLNSTLG